MSNALSTTRTSDMYRACRQALLDHQEVMRSSHARNAVGILKSRFSKKRRISAAGMKLVKECKAEERLALAVKEKAEQTAIRVKECEESKTVALAIKKKAEYTAAKKRKAQMALHLLIAAGYFDKDE